MSFARSATRRDGGTARSTSRGARVRPRGVEMEDKRRSPPRRRTAEPVAPKEGLPPLAPADAVGGLVRATIDSGGLRCRAIRPGTARPCLAVHTADATLHVRELTSRRTRLGSILSEDGAMMRLYVRATLGGSQRQRGWMGVSAACIFFMPDSEPVDTMLRPGDVAEIIRDDDLGTVDLRYCDPIRRASVFAVHKQRLSEVVSTLCTVCDETRTGSEQPPERPGEQTPNACLSPPRVTAPSSPPQTRRLTPSAEREPSSPPPQRAQLAPSPRASPAASSGWVLARRPDVPACISTSNGINRAKWASAGRMLGCGCGASWMAQLEDLTRRVMQARCDKHVDVIDELLGRLRAPERTSVLAALAERSEQLQATRPDSQRIDLLLSRIHSQEGPDLDRMLGFADAPLVMGEAMPTAWAEYSARCAGKGRNAAVYPALAEVLCDAGAGAGLSGWAQLCAYLLASSSHHPSTLYRPVAGVSAAVYRLHERLAPGDLYGWAAPASCTDDERIARDIAAGGSSPSIMFRIWSGTGVPVHLASQYPNEREVLLPPATTFIVEAVTPAAAGLTIDLAYRGVAGSHPELVAEVRRSVAEAGRRLQGLTDGELRERDETLGRQELSREERDGRHVLEEGLYSLRLEAEAAPAQVSPSPRRAYVETPHPPQYDDAQTAATALAHFAPACAGDEASTLRDASRLINFLSGRVREQEWQLEGLQRVVEELRAQQQQSYVRELETERDRLRAALDERAVVTEREISDRIRRGLLQALDEADAEPPAAPDELRARLRFLRKVSGVDADKEAAVFHACRDRVQDELRSEFRKLRETAVVDPDMTHEELRERLRTLTAENNLLSEQDQRSEREALLKEKAAALARADAAEARLEACECEREAESERVRREAEALADLLAGQGHGEVTTRRLLVTRPTADSSLGITHGDLDWRVVAAVEPKGLAAAAGLMPGATLLQANGKELGTGSGSFEEYLGWISARAPVELVVQLPVADERPASRVARMSSALRALRSELLPSSADGHSELGQNAAALSNAWENLSRAAEAIRQLFLYRQGLLTPSEAA